MGILDGGIRQSQLPVLGQSVRNVLNGSLEQQLTFNAPDGMRGDCDPYEAVFHGHNLDPIAVEVPGAFKLAGDFNACFRVGIEL